MEQHAVPQDITGFKFKLVGDMTLKQFGELAFGAIMAYLFFASNWHPLLKWPLAISFAILGVALAFIPIEERPLDVWIINFFRAIYRPTYYVWKKNDATSLSQPPVTGQFKDMRASEPTVQAAAPMTTDQNATTGSGSSPWPYTDTPPFKQITPEEVPKEAVKHEPEAEALPNSMTDTASQGQNPPAEPETPVQNPEGVSPNPAASLAVNPASEPLGAAAITVSAPVPNIAVPSEEKPPENTPGQGATAASLSIEQLMKLREQKLGEAAPAPQEQTQPVPQEAGQNTETTAGPMTIEDLVKQRSLLGTAKAEKVAVELSENEKKVAELTEENKAMLMQIDEIRNQIYKLQMAGQDVTTLQKQLDEILIHKNELMTKLAAAKDEMVQTKVAPLSHPSYFEPTSHPAAKPVPKAASKPTFVSLTSLPNVVNGMVMDGAGVPLDGVILIIKDHEGNSIRALRTNKVGQFIASTPLIDGTYYLELEKANYTFEPWEINLAGNILPPIEIRAIGQQDVSASL